MQSSDAMLKEIDTHVGNLWASVCFSSGSDDSQETVILYVGPQQVFIFPRGNVSPCWSDVSTVLCETDEVKDDDFDNDN